MNQFKFLHFLKYIILSFCLTLVYTSAKAQNYALRHYDANDGLPSSDVFHAMQDSKGYIWFATDNGVSRFNGYEFTNYDISDGLAKNTTLEIFEDYKGRIWFVSIRAELSYYENGKIHQYKYNSLLKEELKAKPVPLKSSFYVDSTDNVFIGVEGYGILKISDTGKLSKVAAEKENPKAKRLIEMPNKKIIVSYYNTIDKVKSLYIKNKVAIPLELPDFPQAIFKHFFVSKIDDGKIIISVNQTLYRIKNYIEAKRIIVPFRIHWQSIDKNDNVWICGAGFGAWRFNANNDTGRPDIKLLKEYSVSSVLEDSKNGFWFTTLHNGVFYLPSFRISYLDKSTGLLKNNINAIGKHNDSIWVGYHSNHINLITGKTIKDIKLSNIEPLEITKIFYDTINKQTVIGSSKYLYTIKSGKITELRNNYVDLDPTLINPFIVKDVISDNKGGYWICGGNGFYHWFNGYTDFDAKVNKNFCLRSSSVFLDGKTLYLGTINGLWKFKNNYLQNLGRINDSFKFRVLDITKFMGKIIIGTKGGGLLILHEDTVSRFTKENGLSSNTITSMDVSSGYLWVGTKNGLNRIEFKNDSNHIDLKVLKFTKAHGLLTNEIRLLKAFDSILYIGTNDGLIKFNVKSIKKDSLGIPLYYNKVMINNKDIPVQALYRLKSNENNLWISFEGISFENGNNIRYKYMMKGLDDDWNYTKNREIRFSFLPPGNYELLISAMNRDEVWNVHPVSMRFIIKKPFWQGLPFILFSLFVVIVLVYFLFRYRVKLAKRKTMFEHERKKYVKKALVNQMNPHFIFNALNSINNYILSNDKNKASKYLTKFSGLIRLFLENSEKEYVSVGEEVRANELYLEIESNRLENGLDYKFIVSGSIDQFKTKIPSLIIQPFLENAIWHGIQPLAAKGEITVTISKKDLSLQIVIKDNGVGRKESAKCRVDNKFKKHSMGIQIIHKRLVILEQLYKEKASIEYSDILDNKKVVGTQVVINLPFVE